VIALPRLYAIIDAAAFLKHEDLITFATELIFGGCTVLQYRNKKWERTRDAGTGA